MQNGASAMAKQAMLLGGGVWRADVGFACRGADLSPMSFPAGELFKRVIDEIHLRVCMHEMRVDVNVQQGWGKALHILTYIC